MQRLFNWLACATIVILLGVIFVPKVTVLARVDSMDDINAAIDGHTYDRLAYDEGTNTFKIIYQVSGPNIGSPVEIHIPVALEDISIH